MFVRTAVVVATTSFFSFSACADWSGGFEAGTQLGSDESPALRAFVRKLDVPLSHYLYLDWIRESGSSRYRLGYNPSYSISRSIFSFGEFSLDKDDPGGIAREFNARVGLGNNIFNTTTNRLTFQAGIGGSKIKFANNAEDTDGYIFAGGFFDSKLIGLIKLEAHLESRLAESQTVSAGEAGLSFRIGPSTALKVAYSAKHYDFRGERKNINNEDSFVTLTYGF